MNVSKLTKKGSCCQNFWCFSFSPILNLFTTFYKISYSCIFRSIWRSFTKYFQTTDWWSKINS